MLFPSTGCLSGDGHVRWSYPKCHLISSVRRYLWAGTPLGRCAGSSVIDHSGALTAHTAHRHSPPPPTALLFHSSPYLLFASLAHQRRQTCLACLSLISKHINSELPFSNLGRLASPRCNVERVGLAGHRDSPSFLLFSSLCTFNASSTPSTVAQSAKTSYKMDRRRKAASLGTLGMHRS